MVDLVGYGLERREGRRVADALGRWIVHAPMRELWMAAELWTHLTHAIAQGDDVVERTSRELVQGFRTASPDVDVAGAHHADRVRVQRFRTTPGTERPNRESSPIDRERLSHLRTRAVPSAEEQHPRDMPRRSARSGEPQEHGERRQCRIDLQAGDAGDSTRIHQTGLMDFLTAGRDERDLGTPPRRPFSVTHTSASNGAARLQNRSSPSPDTARNCVVTDQFARCWFCDST